MQPTVASVLHTRSTQCTHLKYNILFVERVGGYNNIHCSGSKGGSRNRLLTN